MELPSGGNPLVTAAADAVLDIFEKRHIADHVKEVGAYLYEKLEGLKDKYDVVKDHRWCWSDPGSGIYSSCRSDRVQGIIRAEAGAHQCRRQYYPFRSAADH